MWFTYLAKLFSKVSRGSCWSVENHKIGNYHKKNTKRRRQDQQSHLTVCYDKEPIGVDDKNNKGSKGYVEDNDIVTMPHHLQNNVNNF